MLRPNPHPLHPQGATTSAKLPEHQILPSTLSQVPRWRFAQRAPLLGPQGAGKEVHRTSGFGISAADQDHGARPLGSPWPTSLRSSDSDKRLEPERGKHLLVTF